MAGVRVDRCAQCDGIWFDGSELESYLIASSLPADSLASLYVDAAAPGRESKRRCPRCGDVALHLGSFRKHVLEQCPRCLGIFVDARTLIVVTVPFTEKDTDAERGADDEPDATAGTLGALLRLFTMFLR